MAFIEVTRPTSYYPRGIYFTVTARIKTLKINHRMNKQNVSLSYYTLSVLLFLLHSYNCFTANFRQAGSFFQKLVFPHMFCTCSCVIIAADGSSPRSAYPSWNRMYMAGASYGCHLLLKYRHRITLMAKDATY